MEKTKTVTIAKKIEGLAIGLIGVCFFSMGTTYFQERLIYRIPRILVPVYDLFGATALAVTMLLLGLGLIVWGFTKWQSFGGNKSLYLILAVVFLSVGVFLANSYGFFESSEERKSSEDVMQGMEESRVNQIEKVKQATRPNFKNAEIDKYFDDFDNLYARLEKTTSAEDAEKLNNEYNQFLAQSQLADLMKRLNNDQKYEFAQYNAKLSIQWHEKMQELINK